jgi:hypothetical protein
MPRRGKIVALCATVVGLLTLASAAQADTGGQFVCRSSAARVVTFGTPPVATVEPTRANVDGTPCTSSQSAEAVKPTTIGPITADAVRALTTYTPGAPPSVSSDAIISQPKISLPGLTIGVDAVEAHASTTCASTTAHPTLASSSKVVNLTINGNVIAIPPNDQPFSLDLSPLVKLSLNEKITSTAGVITQRALHISSMLGDIVVGEAIAGTAVGNPCSGVPTPPMGVCPTGSTYDASRNVCVISGTNTVVSGPFQGGNGHLGTANGPLATCGHLKGVVFTRSRKTSLSQRYHGHDRVVIRGHVMGCGSHSKQGVVNAQLDVVHIIKGVRHVSKTGVKTRAHGRFTLIEPRNIRSRTIQFAYRGNLAKSKVSSSVTLRYTLRSSKTGRLLQ